MTDDDSVNILLVDDQPGKLLAYRAMLDELGENLIAASSAREALEILLKTEISIVLMDVTKAWVVIGAYVAVLGALSLVQFRRRDVT